MIMTGTAFTDDLHVVEEGLQVFCSEANGSLMMRQGRACLLLWGRRYNGGDAEYPLS